MSLPISHAKIAKLELELDVANYERHYGAGEATDTVVAITMSGQMFHCEYHYDYYGGGGREHHGDTYKRERVRELKEDQAVIRKYCYG
jgi:hypothetical protein